MDSRYVLKRYSKLSMLLSQYVNFFEKKKKKCFRRSWKNPWVMVRGNDLTRRRFTIVNSDNDLSCSPLQNTNDRAFMIWSQETRITCEQIVTFVRRDIELWFVATYPANAEQDALERRRGGVCECKTGCVEKVSSSSYCIAHTFRTQRSSFGHMSFGILRSHNPRLRPRPSSNTINFWNFEFLNRWTTV